MSSGIFSIGRGWDSVHDGTFGDSTKIQCQPQVVMERQSIPERPKTEIRSFTLIKNHADSCEGLGRDRFSFTRRTI
jgi:hypothetical protein